MHLNVAIRFKAVWELQVETASSVQTRSIKVASFIVIPKRTADRNKTKELSDELIGEGTSPHLSGILSSKAQILETVE